MRHRFRRLALGTTVVCALLAGGAQGATAPPAVQHAAGELQLSPPNLISLRQADGNTFVESFGTLEFSGDLVASGTITVRALVHKRADFGEVFTGEWSGQATIDGRSGTLTMHFVGKDELTPGGIFEGKLTAKGSGGLEGLRGHGTFQGIDFIGTGTYTLAYTR